jgi:hypothetical protein
MEWNTEHFRQRCEDADTFELTRGRWSNWKEKGWFMELRKHNGKKKEEIIEEDPQPALVHEIDEVPRAFRTTLIKKPKASVEIIRQVVGSVSNCASPHESFSVSKEASKSIDFTMPPQHGINSYYRSRRAESKVEAGDKRANDEESDLIGLKVMGASKYGLEVASLKDESGYWAPNYNRKIRSELEEEVVQNQGVLACIGEPNRHGKEVEEILAMHYDPQELIQRKHTTRLPLLKLR